MKIICKNGDVLPVDDSAVDYENSFIPCVDTVTMISDTVYLKEIWIATCQRDPSKHGAWKEYKENGLEFVAEEIFNHEPSKEELIHFMSKNGCSLYDIVQVEKAYRLENEFE